MTSSTPAGPAAGAGRTARHDLAQLMRGEKPAGVVREEILSSWRESVATGLCPTSFAPRSDGPRRARATISTAGGPVAECLAHDLVDTDIAVIVCDASGRVVEVHAPLSLRSELERLSLARGCIWRVDVMGTNALGLAVQRNASAVVHGDEHFLDALTHVTTAAAPVNDPGTGKAVGVLGLVCPVTSANSLLMPVARRAARDIEHVVLDSATSRERMLGEHFLRARRHARGPVVAVNEGVLLTNAAAATMVTRADQRRLWSLVAQAVARHCHTTESFLCADGLERDGIVDAIRDGGVVVGAVLRLRLVEDRMRATRGPAPRRALGWESLSDAERALSELVAEGLTNREAAARLFLSPHTVDAHLRHIYSKLDINSRVELARVVAERAASDWRVAPLR